MPDQQWWAAMAERGTNRAAPGGRLVGRADVAAVRQMTTLFSEMDQRHGGGHGRTAVAQYLAVDVVGFLRGRYLDDRVRKDMFSAASELAYVCGWMAFDNAEHGTAQHWFAEAIKLAAEADDLPMAAHVLRAMAHQAIDLRHFDKGLEFAAGSMDGDHYRLAAPRERALLGVVYAKALANAGDTRASAAALLRAEDDLAAAGPGDEEPSRVFFFGEASLAHETACTLRDSGDVDGAVREFRRSVRTRKTSAFTRTHAVTLGYLGSLHASAGNVEEACGIWGRALDAMDGVHSGRTRKVAEDMRSALTPFRRRGIKAVIDIDARAGAYLKTVA
jgi:tetratricopeptide (TPR) repeat protein